MKITNTISLLFLTATATSAFTPMKSMNIRNIARTTPTNRQSPMMPTNPTNPTALNLSDNTIDDFKEKAEEATKLLVVDVRQAQDQLAKNWGWITTSGVLTMALGAAALLLPIFATGVAYDGTVLTIGATGVVSIFGAFARENGHKVKSALAGLLYLGLAAYMGTHPAQGLDIITLTIATVIAAEGLFETALAIRNENLQGRGWHAVSGIGSVIVGLLVSANLPASGLVTPGIALGARLTSNGATKVAVGLTGKEIANQRKQKN